MKKITHVNPNCLDARFCLPHGETGEVKYKMPTPPKVYHEKGCSWCKYRVINGACPNCGEKE